jgi:predicted nucleic acid-binding protein
MIKIFVDTDICIDLLSERMPFNIHAAKLFSLADNHKIKIFVSSISFANIDYVLRSQFSGKSSRQMLAKFKTLVTVLPFDSRTIDLSIASDFADFEDAIQYNTAIENGQSILITRNTKDYKKAHIQVLTPETFLTSRL